MASVSPARVKGYQEMLNKLLKTKPPLEVDGKPGPKTRAEVKKFQKEAGLRPSGDIDDDTAKAMDQAVKTGKIPKDAGKEAAKDEKDGKEAKNLSGKDWFRKNQAKYPNSKDVADLASGFKSKATKFIKALKDAGASVSISATYRSLERAQVMHYSWQVAKGAVKPGDVPRIAGVDINFDHGDDKKSVAAAKEMVAAFGIVYKPSKTTNHAAGTAIDMTITWSGDLTIKDDKGEDVTIDTSPRTGAGNKKLHEIGAGYGCIKLVSDAPHWSENGR